MNLTPNLRSAYMDEAVDRYVYSLLPPRDAVVSEIEDYAAQHDIPIIGPAVARLLALLVQTSGAKCIFEMGSAVGYSTIWLARAAGVASRIKIHTGDALALLAKAPGKFDLIFNDVDKRQYPAALGVALPKLRRGALFITDNTIWSGKAAHPAAPDDWDTLGVQEFNRLVYSSRELYPVLLPLRDGVTVCRKL